MKTWRMLRYLRPALSRIKIMLGAITLLDFPGKFRLQRWVLSRRGVLDSINWVRKRRGKDPLVLDQ